MFSWFRRTFVTGFFVMVPLVVSLVVIVWVFRWADQLTRGLVSSVLTTTGLDQQLGVTHVPGLGIVVTAGIVLLVGALAVNVVGRRLLQQGDRLLLHVPLFRTIYAPVKQLLMAFSPDSEVGFKRMVLVEDASRGFLLGFLTKEFTVDRGGGRETFFAVYVPTNHLYLGDVIVCSPERLTFPDMTVEEGIRVFLTGGMGLPENVRVGPHG